MQWRPFKPWNLRGWRRRPLPDALVIGAQKSGTSALAAYLAQHPRLLLAHRKELEFFGSDLLFSRGLDWYADQWPRGQRRRIRFEASPQYLLMPQAAARIRQCLPQVRLIAVLRDPVYRAYSAWQMYRQQLAEDPRFYERLIAENYTPEEGAALVRRTPAELEDFWLAVRREAHCSQRGVLMEWSVLELGRYGPQLQRYLAHFAREQLLILDAGDLRMRRVATLNRVLAHLGLPPHDWSQANLADVFVGKCGAPMPERAYEFLAAYYRESNAIVASHMDVPPAWALPRAAERRRRAA